MARIFCLASSPSRDAWKACRFGNLSAPFICDPVGCCDISLGTRTVPSCSFGALMSVAIAGADSQRVAPFDGQAAPPCDDFPQRGLHCCSLGGFGESACPHTPTCFGKPKGEPQGTAAVAIGAGQIEDDILHLACRASCAQARARTHLCGCILPHVAFALPLASTPAAPSGRSLEACRGLADRQHIASA
jgi:hypothetical protein